MSAFAPPISKASCGTAGVRLQKAPRHAGARVASTLGTLTVGHANDPVERDADRVADRVVAGRDSGGTSRAPASSTLRRKPAGHAASGAVTMPSFARDLAATRASGGRPLPETTRGSMEPRFDRSLGDVRVHDGARANLLARSIQARAFSLGRDVFFAQGEFQPGTSSGQRLIAHELAHVQQRRGESNVIRRQVADESRSIAAGTCNAAGPEPTEWLGNDALALVRSGGGAVLGRSRGSRGSAVRLVQEALLEWGCTRFRTGLLPRFGADADFGGETESAVRHFQLKERLEVDGVVGPATLARLDEFVLGTTAAPSTPSDRSAAAGPEPSDERALFGTASFKSAQPIRADLGAKTGPSKSGPTAAKEVQATSWIDPFKPRETADRHGFAFVPGMIGQIFFETASTRLDGEDQTELERIPAAYIPVLNQKPPPLLAFAYVGFTDVRRFKGEGGNVALAKGRAQSALDFVDGRFELFGDRARIGKIFPTYQPTAIGFGPDRSPKNVGTDATTLRFFRRVDIYAPTAELERPERKRQPGPPPKSRDFTIQLIVGGSGSVPERPTLPPKVGLGFEIFLLRIQDTTNRRTADFRFEGFTVGFGLSISAGAESEVQAVRTTVPVTLEQWEGFASHAGLQAEIGGTGPSVDEFIFFGPQIHAGAEEVVVRFSEAGGSGAGAGVTPGIPFTPLATGAVELTSRVRRF